MTAAPEVDADWLAVGELAFLAHLATGTVAASVSELIGLEATSENDPALRAGARSLVDRGRVEPTANGFVLEARTAAVASILGDPAGAGAVTLMERNRAIVTWFFAAQIGTDGTVLCLLPLAPGLFRTVLTESSIGALAGSLAADYLREPSPRLVSAVRHLVGAPGHVAALAARWDPPSALIKTVSDPLDGTPPPAVIEVDALFATFDAFFRE